MNNFDTIRLLIADDHSIIRRGLKFIIETNFNINAVAETESIAMLRQLLSAQNYSHLILDMQLKDGNIIEVFQDIRVAYPDTFILIYTTSPEEIFGKRLIQLGANGFLSKQSSEENVLIAIRNFFNRQTYMSPLVKELLNDRNIRKQANDNPFLELSEREISVLNYILKGVTVKDISNQLQLKSSTVATYKARIFDKLGVGNTMDIRLLADLYNYHTS